MTTQIYQIRDYQPDATHYRVLSRMTKEIELYFATEFERCCNADSSPSEMNMDEPA